MSATASAAMSPGPTFIAFALCLSLAFFFGLAFEDFYGRAKENRPGGVRTFPMLALAGGALYLLDPERLLPLSVGLLALGSWLGVYYFRRLRDAGTDGEIAAGMMVPVCNVLAFLLGPVSLAEPVWVPAGMTAAAVLFLTSRDKLHTLARNIEIAELVTAGKFLILTGLVLPLLPDHAVTAFTPITPRQVWLALLAVSGISYASYLLQRYAAPRGGTLIAATLGGLYSSTATAVSLARSARAGTAATVEAQTGILLSTAIMYLRILAIVAVFNLALAGAIASTFLALGASAAALSAGLFAARRESAREALPPAAPANPLAVTTGILFAASFAILSVAIAWARGHFGTAGVYTLAAVAGVADVDPFVLSLAQDRAAAPASAATAIILAASTNNVLKAAYAVFAGGWEKARLPAAGLIALAAAGAAAVL